MCHLESIDKYVRMELDGGMDGIITTYKKKTDSYFEGIDGWVNGRRVGW